MVTGSWSGWHTLSETVNYYGNANPSWYFIRDAVAAADSAVDFSQYTYFVFINAGPNEEISGVASDIWSARWSGLYIPTNDDGGTFEVTHGMISPDIEEEPYGSFGVLCHEYGHELGLPDLYGYAGGVNDYDLMSYGTWNDLGYTPAGLTSYCKYQMGWYPNDYQYMYLLGADTLLLEPLIDPTADPHFLMMYSGSDGTYYFVEARRQLGFDTHIPGERVLVLEWDTNVNRVYKKAELTIGGYFLGGSNPNTPDVEVSVLREDMYQWAFRVYISHKSWSECMRLSPFGDHHSYTTGRSVASVGGYVYVVSQDYRDGNWEIYFKRSTNNGFSWDADLRLTTTSGSSVGPVITAYGSYIYIAWTEDVSGTNEIYFIRSYDYGSAGSWYSAERLTISSGNSIQPAIASYGRDVYVVYQDNRIGNYEIYMRRSDYNGYTWFSEQRLTFHGAGQQYPDVAAYRNYVHVIFQDSRRTETDLFYKRSTTSGSLWEPTKRFTRSTGWELNPRIAAWGDMVYVVWENSRFDSWDIFYKRGTGYGTKFWGDKRLTDMPSTSHNPVVAVKGKRAYIMWQYYVSSTSSYEVYFTETPDRGIHWMSEQMLSISDDFWSNNPSISTSQDNVYVVWTDDKDTPYREVYFAYRW
jgi:M6 family metalloprotease-like protein